MLGPVEMLVFIISLAISLGIVVPLQGVLVRLRANYNPKSLQLDTEGGATPHAGPIVTSYFSMMGRVYRLEGWGGLYKGIMPAVLSTGIITFVMLALMEAPRPRHGQYRAPDAGVIATLFYTLAMMVISLPVAIISYRTITTPHKLPYFNAAKSLRVLLTPSERRKPWILYLAPGLLAAQISHTLYVVLVLATLRRVLLPSLTQEGLPKTSDFSPVRLSIYIVLVCFSTAILTPLEVLSIRLAIQRNHANPEFNSVAQEEDGDAEPVAEYEYAAQDEDVIGLRREEDPYTGLVDCAKRIVDEEGVGAIYRAWWLTLLGSLASAFS